jgi:hypothetical protein
VKQFRGTLLALLALLVVAGAWFALAPHDEPKPVASAKKKDKANEEGIPLFAFEKQDLVRVEVKRPQDTIVLVEKGDGWWIEGENVRAAKSMVNRVKHQLHDLVSRATVVEDADGALYGLGESAIHVTLTFRDGSVKAFDAGDPNPSGVSFYIRPNPGDVVYTVKKSAVDYYALDLTEFRERRFATFDSKDVDAIEATLPGGKGLKFQKTGERQWQMVAPAQIPGNDSDVRSLLGRVSALKAVSFVADEAPDLAKYGLAAPRATITVRFSARKPLTLLVGDRTGEKDGDYFLAYMKLADEDSIYAARDGLLDDFARDPGEFRLQRFVRMDPNRIARVTATWADTGKDKDLAGTVTVRMAADKWQWDDGVLVPGSTPKRVAQRAAGLESDTFVSDHPEDHRYGFDTPLAVVELLDLDGVTRKVIIGKPGTPTKDPDGHDRERFYARVDDYPEVYLVDGSLPEVVKDLMREHRRKAEGDAAEAVRHERIQEEVKP